LNALPIDREVTGRKSSDLIRDLIADGHSLLIYPEGGRSPDGWGQEFKGGAAYLSSRTGAPVMPVFIDGTGAIFGKGMKRPKPGRVEGDLRGPAAAEGGRERPAGSTRASRQAVTRLGDEALTDFWTRDASVPRQDTSPSLTGPEYNGWRRQWELGERRKLGAAGLRRRQKRRWPDLG
jgi:1-acyl-sn-glycerol-3-phosphate acyltransferase